MDFQNPKPSAPRCKPLFTDWEEETLELGFWLRPIMSCVTYTNYSDLAYPL